MARPFRDRREAGRALAAALEALGEADPVLLALPRGGVPVAAEMAELSGAQLDALLVRKVGAPGNPELGIGAVAEGNVRILDDEAIAALRIADQEVASALGRAEAELAERIARFRDGLPPVDIAGRTVVIVDDGLATGGTAAAAVEAARRLGATRVVVAVPVGAREVCERLRSLADEVICLIVPEPLHAVGHWYDDFTQVADAEVQELLAAPVAEGPQGSVPLPEAVRVRVGERIELNGDLTVPTDAIGLVLFAHGSGSSRHSPRNRFVADVMREAGLGTLLFDLLTADEERQRANVFDIDLLQRRLVDVITWLRHELHRLRGSEPVSLGLFGASTGAAAALAVAARPGTDISAVVSRGGRPDLAEDALAQVRVPTLLIVGGHDQAVLELNRSAQTRLRGVSELAVVPGASHLFSEPGTLSRAAELARDWFLDHFPER